MRRSLWWALAVAGGLSLFALFGEGEEESLAPVRSASGPRSAAPSRAPTRGAATVAKAATDAALSRDLIQNLRAWQSRSGQSQPAAPAPAAGTAWASVAPPAPHAPSSGAVPQAIEDAQPTAPPFPHEWVGRFQDRQASRWIQRAVLSGARRTLVVKAGDVIEGQWRVDGIQERTMTVTYLPLNQPQTVAMK